MPSDEYSAVGGGGALKLKGAKVVKKKKKMSSKSDLEKNLSQGDNAVARTGSPGKDKTKKTDEVPDEEKEDHIDVPASRRMTESERQFEALKKKRLMDLAEASGGRPQLLKTHKERVEQFNTYLSKLSEHHDMPKIGPG
ncbi:hypothetical protein S40293_03533 [Stachybotrys chartarum IBT 40293]|nr:hypothetical protein S40293_03533 [Stachybotrys chartarum IBT 40293]